MAKDKVWVDCPICGSDGSMSLKTNKIFESNKSDFGPIKVSGLSGYFCKKCGDGFFNIKSQNIINAHIAEVRAIRASKVVMVSEVTTLEMLAKTLHSSKQYAHKIMREGKVPAVYVAGEMKPFNQSILKAKEIYSARLKRERKLVKN